MVCGHLPTYRVGQCPPLLEMKQGEFPVKPKRTEQLAADDGGRVQPRRVQDLHDHGGGGGFAVGPADPQRIPVPAGDRPQHPGPLPQRQAAFPRGDQLGVGFHDGGGIEDEIGAPDILGPLFLRC